MYTRFLLIILMFTIKSSAFSQLTNGVDLDCIRISDIEYLVLIKNNTSHSIYVPCSPKISFQGDSMYAGITLPYKPSSCNFYIYTIAGKRIRTVHALKTTIPDSIYRQYTGGIPNFSVPGTLFEVKPDESHCLKFFGRGCVNPSVLIFEIEMVNYNSIFREKGNVITIIQDMK